MSLLELYFTPQSVTLPPPLSKVQLTVASTFVMPLTEVTTTVGCVTGRAVKL